MAVFIDLTAGLPTGFPIVQGLNRHPRVMLMPNFKDVGDRGSDFGVLLLEDTSVVTVGVIRYGESHNRNRVNLHSAERIGNAMGSGNENVVNRSDGDKGKEHQRIPLQA